MPPTNAKNQSLGGAASDLGLGDMLNQQRVDETDEEKKRRQKMMAQQAMSPGAQALMGSGGLGLDGY